MVCTKMTQKKKLVEAPETESSKADVVLKDGKEIFFDFNAVSFKEMLGIFNKEETVEKTNTTIAKVCGFASLEEFYENGAKDVRKCQKGVVKSWLNWQNDPND